MPPKVSDEKIAQWLIAGKTPLVFKRYEDGSFAVIHPNGRKFKFTPAQVDIAVLNLTPKAATRMASKSAPKSSPSTQKPSQMQEKPD
jgi:hypothetical protein